MADKDSKQTILGPLQVDETFLRFSKLETGGVTVAGGDGVNAELKKKGQEPKYKAHQIRYEFIFGDERHVSSLAKIVEDAIKPNKINEANQSRTLRSGETIDTADARLRKLAIDSQKNPVKVLCYAKYQKEPKGQKTADSAMKAFQSLSVEEQEKFREMFNS